MQKLIFKPAKTGCTAFGKRSCQKAVAASPVQWHG
jgi:hypothetical protein